MIIQSLLGEGSMFGGDDAVMQLRGVLPPVLHVLSLRVVEGGCYREGCEEGLTQLATLCTPPRAPALKICVPRCSEEDEVWLRSRFSNVEVGTKMWGKIDKMQAKH